MPGKQQKEKLDRVLGFYQQELETLKVRCLQQKKIVADLRDTLASFDDQVRTLQSQSNGLGIAIIDRQMVCQLMEKLQKAITQTQEELDQANVILIDRQDDLRKKMSQMESLEKLIEKKAELIAFEVRRHEQQVADERYLNQHKSGSIK